VRTVYSLAAGIARYPPVVADRASWRGLIGAWQFAPRMIKRSLAVVIKRLAVCTLAAGGLIVATASAESLSVVLGF